MAESLRSKYRKSSPLCERSMTLFSSDDVISHVDLTCRYFTSRRGFVFGLGFFFCFSERLEVGNYKFPPLVEYSTSMLTNCIPAKIS